MTSNYQKSLWLYPLEVPLSATASSASHLFIISYAWPNSSIAWHAKLAAVLENCTRSKRLWKWRLLRKKVRADVRNLLLCILYRDVCFTLNLNTRDACLTDRSMISYIDIPDISAQRFSLARRRDFTLSIRNKSAGFSGQYGRITQYNSSEKMHCLS